jgi:hypothetical protein
VPLTVVVDGMAGAAGTVDAVPVGGAGPSIHCAYPGPVSGPVTCTALYPPGTLVELDATPGVNSAFAGWSGACAGTGGCAVTMNAAASVGAHFGLGGSCVVTVSDQTISGTASYEACHAILAGPALAVVAPGNLTLRASTLVVLRNGVSVGPGTRLTIALGDAPG